MTTRYYTYDLQLQDTSKNVAVITAGGKFIITGSGTGAKATLYDPDNGFAALANPITPVRGKLRFATLDTVTQVDIYGFAPGGQFLSSRGQKPAANGELPVNGAGVNQVAVIPIYAGDYTAASEVDTGLDFPAGAVLLPTPSLKVITAQSGKTIEIGLLSSESGGDADGLVDAASIGTAGAVIMATSGTPTLGALLVQNFGTTPAVNAFKPYPVAVATSITVTTSSATTTADLLAILPYQLPPV